MCKGTIRKRRRELFNIKSGKQKRRGKSRRGRNGKGHEMCSMKGQGCNNKTTSIKMNRTAKKATAKRTYVVLKVGKSAPLLIDSSTVANV